MYLTRLQLEQFRTYEHLDLEIPREGLRLVGNNASGKTSVMEALVLLSTMRSPRTSVDRELVRWGSGESFGVPPFTRMEADLRTDGHQQRVGISVELDTDRRANQRKGYFLNGDPVRALDLMGVLKSVLFSPEDVLLVAGVPAERRRQLDILVSQFDRGYLHSLAQFTRVLTQRNQLLKRYSRERRSPRDPAAVTEMSFWDEQLVESGAHVVATRVQISRALSDEMTIRSMSLVDGASISLRYQPRLSLDDVLESPGPDTRQLVDMIALRFSQGLEEVRRDEYRRGQTLIGPQRDDVSFLIGGESLGSYGSRGQQRLGVVAFRLAQIRLLENRTGEPPVLLLDDVLSELDAKHRDLLISEVTESGCQVLLTSAEVDALDHPGLTRLPKARVHGGTVQLDS